MKPTLPTANPILALCLSLALASCAPGSSAGVAEGTPPGGKADEGAEVDCLYGRYEVEGDFPSFSRWTFELRGGQLVDSLTDDLGADEWSTTLVRDDSAHRISLVQVTHASDAIIETTLHLQQAGCERGGATLAPLAAYTVTWDETAGEHGLETHRIRLVSGPGEPADADQAVVDARVAAILTEQGLDRLPFEVPAAELARQEALDNAVPFDDALRKALESFLTDGDDIESPYGLINEELGYGPFEDPCMQGEDVTAAVRCFMNQPTSGLRLLAIEDSPEGGESPAESWVFSLSLDSLSDHGHWAVIDRSDPAAPVYNYGFN